MREYEKSINTTWIDYDYFRSGTAQFDMSAICITDKSGQQIIIDNEDFEKLINEYNRRIQELEYINK